MTDLTSRLKKWLFPPSAGPGVPAGLRSHVVEKDGRTARTVLRVDDDGRGWLLCGAVALRRLDAADVLLARQILDDVDDETAIALTRDRTPDADPASLAARLAELRGCLGAPFAPPPAAPHAGLEAGPDPRNADTPLQADLEVDDADRLGPLLDAVWDAGIPTVCIHGRPEVEAASLVRAIAGAGDVGLLSWVRAPATRLRADGLLDSLADAGLDGLVIPFASCTALIHDTLLGPGDYVAGRFAAQRARDRGIAVLAEVPLLATAPHELGLLRAFLDDLGVAGAVLWCLADAGTAERSATEESADISATERSDDGVDTIRGPGARVPDALAAAALGEVAAEVEKLAQSAPCAVSWLPPTHHDVVTGIPAQVQVGPRCLRASAVRIAPDGGILPPRGPAIAVGSLGAEGWAPIARGTPYRRYLEHLPKARRCDDCPDLALCAPLCPKEPAGWTDDRLSDP